MLREPQAEVVLAGTRRDRRARKQGDAVGCGRRRKRQSRDQLAVTMVETHFELPEDRALARVADVQGLGIAAKSS